MGFAGSSIKNLKKKRRLVIFSPVRLAQHCASKERIEND
jgi:hypothetical protein